MSTPHIKIDYSASHVVLADASVEIVFVTQSHSPLRLSGDSWVMSFSSPDAAVYLPRNWIAV